MAEKKRGYGTVLREAREKSGFTQRELANKLAIGVSYIGFLENEDRRPSIKLLTKLVEVLQLNGREMLFLVHPEAKTLVMGRNGDP